MTRPLCLLTHPDGVRERYFGARALAALRDVAEVRLNARERPMTAPELIEAARDADVIVSDRATPGEAGLFAALPGLRAFVRVAVDIRTVDVEAASRYGVLVTRTSAGFVPAVCEWIVGAMVDLARGISRAVVEYRAGRAPTIAMGRQLAGSALGIIGYGRIGRRLAEIALALGMRVVVCDPHVRIETPGVAQCDLAALLADADFVVCLALATAETENLMNAAAFAAMRQGAFFVNASRGNLVDEEALAAALDRGHLAGAAMDVGRAPDQMPSPALARRADVIATPHIGGLTPQAVEHQAVEAAAQAVAILAGRIPDGAVNAAAARRIANLT